MSDNSKAPGCIEALMYFLIVVFIGGCLFNEEYQKPFIFFSVLGIIVVLYIIVRIINKD
jgi:hypothetical protein